MFYIILKYQNNILLNVEEKINMLIKSFIEIEDTLTNLSDASKHKLISNIGYLLVKSIAQQNNTNLINEIQKLSSMLSPDKQADLLQSINSLTLKYLTMYCDKNIFDIFNNLLNELNVEEHQKILSETNDILEIFLKVNSFKESNIKQPEVKKLNEKELVVKENIDSEQKTNLIPPPPPPPPSTISPKPIDSIFTTTLSGKLKNSNSNNEIVLTPVTNYEPPPPPINSRTAPSVFTTTLSGRLKESSFNKLINEPISLEESFKYLIPEKINDNIGNIPKEALNLLNLVDDKKSLSEIHNQSYSETDIVSLIPNLYLLFNNKLITFKKRPESDNKNMKLRTGEWLCNLKFIEQDILAKLLRIYKTVLLIEENNRKLISADTSLKVNSFGKHLVEINVITEEQLEKMIEIKSQFNEIIDSTNKN